MIFRIVPVRSDKRQYGIECNGRIRSCIYINGRIRSCIYIIATGATRLVFRGVSEFLHSVVVSLDINYRP